MSLLRPIFVVLFVLSASVSSAMEVRHSVGIEHHKIAAGEMADDQRACCSESSKHTQICLILPALLRSAALNDNVPDVVIVTGVFLTGIEPRGSLRTSAR